MRWFDLPNGARINLDAVLMVADSTDGGLVLFFPGLQIPIPITDRARVLEALTPRPASLLGGRFPLLRTGGEPTGDPS